MHIIYYYYKLYTYFADCVINISYLKLTPNRVMAIAIV